MKNPTPAQKNKLCQTCAHRRNYFCKKHGDEIRRLVKTRATCEGWGNEPEPVIVPRPTRAAVLVAMFDPTDSPVLWDNYRKFRAALDPRADVFVAEVTYTGNFHEPAAAVKIHANDKQVLWQKERLLNLLLDQLPPEYDAVLWADADIIFNSPTWLDDTLKQLQDHQVVYPFSEVTRLDALGGVERRQLSAPLVSRKPKAAAPLWHRDPAQGLSWAFRREWIDRHRFNDCVMNGAGDSYEYFSILGDHAWGRRHCTAAEYEQWKHRAMTLEGTTIGAAPGHITHLYHGSKENRQYKPLEELLLSIDFNPAHDIKLAGNGLWEWAGDPAAYSVIRESFFKRQMDDRPGGRLYSEFLTDGSTRTTWDSPLGEAIISKHAAKLFARRLNFPKMRVPETYRIRGNSVIKPDRDCGGRRVRIIENPENWIYEEYIKHDRDYRLYAFSGRVVMLQIDTCKETAAGMNKTGYVYKQYPSWRTLEIDQGLIDRPELQIEAGKPKCLTMMVRIAEEISHHYPVPVRVDFFVDENDKPVFNEMSITPGLIKDGRITPAGDAWLGGFISEPLVNLVESHRPPAGPAPLPDDAGILTSADAAFFPAFQLLFASVLSRYKTRFAVVDLGMSGRQRAWCDHQETITLIDLPESLPVGRGADVWQNWNKPLYFQMSPFKRNLWIDSDCVVMGGLEYMAAMLDDHFYTCECVSNYRRRDRFNFPHRYFGTAPVNDALVMAGICGFDRERDAEFIAAWLGKCVELEKAPRKMRVMRDQEALQWMVDTHGLTGRIIRGDLWNECRADYNAAGPAEFLNSLDKTAANIYHFYGKSKGTPAFWTDWGEIPVW